MDKNLTNKIKQFINKESKENIFNESIFENISFAPDTQKDNALLAPFWQILDILDNARFILRRRHTAEVEERAALILQKMSEFKADMVEDEECAELEALLQDDLATLEFLMLPERAYPFHQSIEEQAECAPWAAETGWIIAEDMAVLALTSVDKAISKLRETGDDSKDCAASNLLDAYRCILHAERAGGRYVQSEDEFYETMAYLGETRNRFNNLKKSKATTFRTKQQLKNRIIECYHKLQLEQPKASKRQLAMTIFDNYEEPSPEFAEFAGILKDEVGRFKRIYQWILDAAKLDKIESENTAEELPLKSALKIKYRF